LLGFCGNGGGEKVKYECSGIFMVKVDCELDNVGEISKEVGEALKKGKGIKYDLISIKEIPTSALECGKEECDGCGECKQV